jgi:hypothetical protein
MAGGNQFRGRMKWVLIVALLTGVLTFFAVRFLTKQAEGPVGKEGRIAPAFLLAEADWTRYGSDKEGRHYYKKVDDAKSSPGIERVWTRVDFNEEGKDRYLAKRQSVGMATQSYEGFTRRYVFYELNCFSEKREYSTQEVFDLTGDGKTLDYAKAGSYKDWQDVPPDSTLDELCRIVCPPKKM